MSEFECDQMLCQALEAEAGFGDWTGLDPEGCGRSGRGRYRRRNIGWDGSEWDEYYKEPGQLYDEQLEYVARRKREAEERQRRLDEYLKKYCRKCKGYLVNVDDMFSWLDQTTNQYGIVFDVEVDPFVNPGLVLTFKTLRKGHEFVVEMREGNLKVGDCVEFWYRGEFQYCYSMVTLPVRSKWEDDDIRRLDLRNV